MKLFLFSILVLHVVASFASPSISTSFIHIDQFGYLSQSKKVAVVSDPQVGYNANASYSPGTGIGQYQVRRWQDDFVVYAGTLIVWNNGAVHQQSGDKGWWFDFTTVTEPGSYYIYDAGTGASSYRFEIGPHVYTDVLKQACRMFYYQRCNFRKEKPYADAKWTDGAAFDGARQDHHARNRWDKNNPATEKDVSGGWFDAGDLNKYVPNTVEPLTQLLEVYRLHPAVFTENLNLPESGNGVPDILDEVKYEIDWLVKMQDATGTGGLMLKVGVDNYDMYTPPSADIRNRYYLPECTSSTVSGALVFALASNVYRSLNIPVITNYSNDLLLRSIKAWDRAKITTADFTNFQTNCDDGNIKSGLADQSADWQRQCVLATAIYLYEATGSDTYKTYIEKNYLSVGPVGNGYWGPYLLFMQRALLRYSKLPNVTPFVAYAITYSKQNTNTHTSLPEYKNATDLYRAYLVDGQYTWGSNMARSACGSNALDYVHFDINTSSKADYKELAEQYMHWLHGVNPIGIVMLSNMYAYGADSSANEIYHSWFADGTIYDNARTSANGPAPGFVTGGPNREFSVTSLLPPYNQPVQKAYKDWNTNWNGTFNENSFECTEPAIYYQAMYIELLAAVIDYGSDSSNTTPAAPALTGDDVANTLSASHPLGDSVILVCENGGPYLPYKGAINVTNVARPIGYWKFKVKSASKRNESAVVSSPVYTVTTTPVTPTLSADDAANTLSASHPLGDSVILVCENDGPYLPYTSTISVGNVAKPVGNWKFKIKSGPGRNESEVVNSPIFTYNAPLPGINNFFRSKRTGNWNDATIWESSNDSINWSATPLSPNANANSITINKDHTVAVDSILQIDQLTIKNGGVLKIASTAMLIIDNGLGEDIEIEPDGQLILQSDSLNTASIGPSTGTIKGNVTVERYVPAKRAYRFITAPVNSIANIRGNWMENTNNSNATSNNNPAPGYGTHITGSAGDINGFDETKTNNTSLFTFNNQNQTWTTVSNTNGFLNPGFPYRIFIRGDRSINLNSNSADPTPTILRSTGTIVTGDIVMAEPGKGGLPGIPDLSTIDNGYSFVANPYPSSIDWKKVQKKDVSKTVYYFDPNLTGSYGRGSYTSYNELLGVVSNPGSKADNYLQSGQAFFVQTTGPHPYLNFNEDCKTTTQKHVFRSPDSLTHIRIALLLPGQASSQNPADGLSIYFSNDFRNDIGEEDSYKFTNMDENIGIVSNGKVLSIEGRKPVSSLDTLQLKAWQLLEGKYVLSVNVDNFSDSLSAFLEDRYLQSKTYLPNNTETQVAFSITSDTPSYSADRFKITFKKAIALSVQALDLYVSAQKQGMLVEWWVMLQQKPSSFEIQKSFDGHNFYTIHSEPPRDEGEINQKYKWLDVEAFAGVVYYRIKAIDKSGGIIFSRIFKAERNIDEETFSIYPNPVVGNNLSLSGTNVKRGVYNITITNSSGMVILNSQINHTTSQLNQVFKLPLLSHGFYQLKIEGNGLEYVKQLIK